MSCGPQFSRRRHGSTYGGTAIPPRGRASSGRGTPSFFQTPNSLLASFGLAFCVCSRWRCYMIDYIFVTIFSSRNLSFSRSVAEAFSLCRGDDNERPTTNPTRLPPLASCIVTMGMSSENTPGDDSPAQDSHANTHEQSGLRRTAAKVGRFLWSQHIVIGFALGCLFGYLFPREKTPPSSGRGTPSHSADTDPRCGRPRRYHQVRVLHHLWRHRLHLSRQRTSTVPCQAAGAYDEHPPAYRCAIHQFHLVSRRLAQ